MTRDQQRTRKAQQRCDAFNGQYPIGTPVRYYPYLGDATGSVATHTSCRAYVLSGHTAVVGVDSQRGCVALDHVLPIVASAANVA